MEALLAVFQGHSQYLLQCFHWTSCCCRSWYLLSCGVTSDSMLWPLAQMVLLLLVLRDWCCLTWPALLQCYSLLLTTVISVGQVLLMATLLVADRGHCCCIFSSSDTLFIPFHSMTQLPTSQPLVVHSLLFSSSAAHLTNSMPLFNPQQHPPSNSGAIQYKREAGDEGMYCPCHVSSLPPIISKPFFSTVFFILSLWEDFGVHLNQRSAHFHWSTNWFLDQYQRQW